MSKADSTGFLDILHLDKSAGSVIRNVVVTFLRFLIRARSAGPRLVLSLFARSQNQYLFPGSVEYAGKHVLDDRQLIKWWCKTLDPVVRYSGRGVDYDSSDTAAYVLIPGCDKLETRSFFPASAKQDLPHGSRWRASYPMELLVPDVSAPLRCLIPRFPDDPKSRFLTDLDDSKDKKGQWRSVKTMEQFWEMMSYRQECSAGRLVGFMWVVFGKQEAKLQEPGTNGQAGEVQERRTAATAAVLPTPAPAQVPSNSMNAAHEIIAADLDGVTLPVSPLPSSPLLPSHEPGAQEAGDADAEAAEQYYDDDQASPIDWPRETRGELVVSAEQYDTLIDHLLQLDFSIRADGEQGTTSFIVQAADLAGRSWGQLITGRRATLVDTGAAPMLQDNGANLLTGVRKKRKVDVVEEKSAGAPPAINTLSAGLVRKKIRTSNA